MKVTRNMCSTKVVQCLNPPSCCLLFCLQATDGGCGPARCFIPSQGGWILSYGVTVRHNCHVFVTAAVTKLWLGVVRADSSRRSKLASTRSPGQVTASWGREKKRWARQRFCHHTMPWILYATVTKLYDLSLRISKNIIFILQHYNSICTFIPP